MNTSEYHDRIVDFLEFINAQEDSQTIEQNSGWDRCAVGKASGLSLDLTDQEYTHIAESVMTPLIEALECFVPEFHEALNDAGNTEAFPTYAELKEYVNEAPELTKYLN